MIAKDSVNNDSRSLSDELNFCAISTTLKIEACWEIRITLCIAASDVGEDRFFDSCLDDSSHCSKNRKSSTVEFPVVSQTHVRHPLQSSSPIAPIPKPLLTTLASCFKLISPLTNSTSQSASAFAYISACKTLPNWFFMSRAGPQAELDLSWLPVPSTSFYVWSLKRNTVKVQQRLNEGILDQYSSSPLAEITVSSKMQRRELNLPVCPCTRAD